MFRILFRDMLFIMLLAFVTIIIWMLPHIKDAEKKAESDIPPGFVTVLITWPPGDTDVDLWVTGPGEPVPIGYSNANGVLWNHKRDDLGKDPDYTPLNYEEADTRGSPPGEYIINLHCFRCAVVPQRVTVEVGSSKGMLGGKGTVQLVTSTVDLKANGQERTAIRFRLDANGDLVPGSLNYVFQPLRAGGLGNGMGGYGAPPQ